MRYRKDNAKEFSVLQYLNDQQLKLTKECRPFFMNKSYKTNTVKYSKMSKLFLKYI